MKSLGAVLLAWCAVTVVEAREAEACSQPACWTGYFVPGEGATVPANLPAIHWRPVRNSVDRTAPDPTQVSLETDAGVKVALTARAVDNGDWVFTIDQPLVEGTRYVLRDRNACAEQLGPSAAFTAAAAAPLPTALGALTASDRRIGAVEVATTSGSCSVEVEADRVGVELALAAAAQPWRDVLLYETRVDGQRWTPERSIRASQAAGESWLGRGVDQLYTTCNLPEGQIGGLAEGAHQVTMQATLAGTSVALSATAVPVELSCATPPPGEDCETTRLADGSCAPGEASGGCSTGGATGLGAFGLLGLAMIARRRGRR